MPMKFQPVTITIDGVAIDAFQKVLVPVELPEARKTDFVDSRGADLFLPEVYEMQISEAAMVDVVK